jgi:uncharacterized protein (DUF885 family)
MADSTATARASLDALAERILDAHYEAHPEEARFGGLHAYDGRLPDIGEGGIARRAEELEGALEELDSIDSAALDPDRTLDWRVLRAACRRELVGIRDLRLWSRNPLVALDQIDLTRYLIGDHAPRGDRAAALCLHLKGIPRALDQIRSQLEPVLDRTITSTARRLVRGFVLFVEGELGDALTDAHGDDAMLRRALLQARQQAAEAGREFIAFLEDRLAESRPDVFPLGPEVFAKRLATAEGIDTDPDRLLEIGERDLERNQRDLRETARAIDPRAEPKDLIRRLSTEAPEARGLVDAARDVLEDLRRWVAQREIVSIPSSIECHVAETPPYRSFAFSMLDGPGALTVQREPGTFYVTPPRPEWDESTAEDWLREFCRPELILKAVYRVWPGHFLHGLHLRRNPSRVVRTFRSSSSAEAWADYAVEMTVEAGYGDGDPALRLFQLRGAVVRNVRLITAIRMHTRGMTVDEAHRLFRGEADLSEAAARTEAVRGTFDPGAVRYTLGKRMLVKLRDDLRAARGSGYSDRAFHDEFLYWGMVPIPIVRDRILAGNPS